MTNKAKCEHPVMCRANKQCPNRARYRIVGETALDLFGYRVALVCGRHANTIANLRPATVLESLERSQP